MPAPERWCPGRQSSGIACLRPLCLSHTVFDLSLNRSSTQFTKMQISEALALEMCFLWWNWLLGVCFLAAGHAVPGVTAWETWSCAFRGWEPVFPVQCCHSSILVKVVTFYFTTLVGVRQVAAGVLPGRVHSLSYIIRSSSSLRSSHRKS